MKNSEFRRRLAHVGATFKEGSKHTKIYLNNRQSTIPRHKADLGTGLVKEILRRLDVKEF